MVEPLNISHPFDSIWAGDPYDPNPATFPDDPAAPGTPKSTPPPSHPPAPSFTVRQLVEKHAAPHSATWYVQKGEAEAACILPCAWALHAGKLKMEDGGIAEKMLDHFLSGSSEPVYVDLDAEFERNPQLREYVTSRIQSDMYEKALYGERAQDMNGAIWVPQSAYGPTPAGRDQQLALGGTYFEYQVVADAPGGKLDVKVNVADHYFWSPSEKDRPTHCLHVCGDRLVTEGKATDFFQFGEGHLIVEDPTSEAAKKNRKLEVEAPDDL